MLVAAKLASTQLTQFTPTFLFAGVEVRIDPNNIYFTLFTRTEENWVVPGQLSTAMALLLAAAAAARFAVVAPPKSAACWD